MATIKGDRFNNDIDGRSGADLILGLAGNDELDGDQGNDLLKGGSGRDELDGGAGNDTLFGGKGDDIFTFDNNDGRDVIGDFKSGDRIEFDIDNLRFEDLSLTSKGGDTVITWDGGGSNSITLDGVDPNSLSRADFMFDD